MNINVVGENIAKFRRKRKMTQEQLAEASDLTKNFLSKIERGQAQNFSAINLLKLANALNISVDELVEGAHERKAIKPKPNQAELIHLLNKMDSDMSERVAKSFVQTIKSLTNKKNS
ncbi:helix-turn-helix domain-containing protein [Limosilactobacillus antri]|uniref:helix-turn-helix domain-containing protein n=1 Tax=Limosilactobacillus antri TaxID=227943 RepID=UPI001F5AB9AC|nr:helix-turn-helix transcriptional regulator [Limosilactobacillus antri]